MSGRGRPRPARHGAPVRKKKRRGRRRSSRTAKPPALVLVDRKELRYHPLVAPFRRLSERLGLWAWGHFLEESTTSLWRTRAQTGFAVVIIALSLATVGSFLLVAQNLRQVVERVSSLAVAVYLDDDLEESAAVALRDAVAARPGVESVRFVSRDEAAASFRATNPELAAMAAALGENPFPASLEVMLTDAAREPAALGRFADTVEAMAGVDHVGRDLELAQRVAAASRVVQVVAVALGSVLLLAALVTVATVVKLTVYARRNEVAILRLVGATPGYVRGTFVFEGVIQGVAGSVLALVVLYAVYRLAGGWLGSDAVGGVLSSLTTRFLTAGGSVALVLSGVVLGAVGSLMPLRNVGVGQV